MANTCFALFLGINHHARNIRLCSGITISDCALLASYTDSCQQLADWGTRASCGGPGLGGCVGSDAGSDEASGAEACSQSGFAARLSAVGGALWDNR